MYIYIYIQRKVCAPKRIQRRFKRVEMQLRSGR